MKRIYILVSVFIISLTILPLSQFVQADDDDYIEAKRLLKAGEILPLEQILQKVRKSYPGKILEIELEKEDGYIIYEIEILASNGVVKELYINAKNGKLISIKEDD